MYCFGIEDSLGLINCLPGYSDCPTLQYQCDGVLGDFCPIAIIFLDGDPSDEWREAARALKEHAQTKPIMIGIGCGADVNIAALREITENALLMENLSAGAFQNLICWIDQDSP
jgi:uncharacterized protein YegL